MKVVLLQKVGGLGNIDDIKEVSEGYARNYLFPKNLAVLATPKFIKDANAHHNKKERDLEKDLVKTQKLADRLDGFRLTIEEKANEAGFLYAAVGSQKIAEALQMAGFEVEKKMVDAEPIKNVGVFKVKVKPGHSLVALVEVTVNSKKEN